VSSGHLVGAVRWRCSTGVNAIPMASICAESELREAPKAVRLNQYVDDERRIAHGTSE